MLKMLDFHNQAEAFVVGAAAKAWADGPLAEQRLPYAKLEESRGSGPSLVESKTRQRPAKVWCPLHDASLYHTVVLCTLPLFISLVCGQRLWPVAVQH